MGAHRVLRCRADRWSAMKFYFSPPPAAISALKWQTAEQPRSRAVIDQSRRASRCSSCCSWSAYPTRVRHSRSMRCKRGGTATAAGNGGGTLTPHAR